MTPFFQRVLEFDRQASGRLRLTPNQSSPLWWLAAILAHSGDSWYWMAGLVLIWLIGSPEWRFRAAVLSISIVIQALVVFAFKFTIRRSRPAGEWGAVYRNTDPHSFPSGHATRAFVLLALFAGLGPMPVFLFMLAWAPMVSLARVMTGVHYISDVLAGLALGLAFGWVMLQVYPWFQSSFPFLFSPLFPGL
jgi:membrane-associated phospholipid phosphatase